MIPSSFQQLVDIMAKLRSKEGCPWDKEQTHESLKPYLLEETYEVLESLDNEDNDGLEEELGDLLLQIVFHAQIAQEQGRFNILDVIDGINAKLVRRHPHVFGQMEINSSEEQRIHWEKLKKKEGKESVLEGVPKAMPALLRARRIQQKATTVGFDWDNIDQVWEKVEEETKELDEAIAYSSPTHIKEEFGDLLFALVNLSRFLKIDPEDALRQAVIKFETRFRRVEKTFESLKKDIREASLEEMDAVWNRIKHE